MPPRILIFTPARGTVSTPGRVTGIPRWPITVRVRTGQDQLGPGTTGGVRGIRVITHTSGAPFPGWTSAVVSNPSLEYSRTLLCVGQVFLKPIVLLSGDCTISDSVRTID